MDNREFFLKAIKGEKTDRVPIYDYIYSRDVYEAMIGRRPKNYNGVDLVECAKALGLGMVQYGPEGPAGWKPVFLKDDIYIDEWGVTYKKDEHAWPCDAPIDYPIKNRDDFRNFKQPDPNAHGRLDGLKNVIKRAAQEIAVSGVAAGPFTQAWTLMGPEHLLISMYEDPDLVRDVLKMSTEYWIELVKMQIDAGVDLICICDDLGSNTAPFISHDLFHKVVLPFLAEIADVVKRRNLPLMMHSDGNINILIDDLIDIGVDALHPLQRSAGMDLRRIKEKYGDRLTIIGNVNSSTTLPFGTEEDVEEEVMECLEIAKPGGRYVLASDHSLHEGIPVKNILKMFETAKKYGNY